MKRRVVPTLVRLAKRVRAHVFKETPAEEIAEELDFHIEMRIREHLRRGRTIGEARALAEARFGDIERVKAVCRRIGERRERTMTRRAWWRDVRDDVGFALRQMRRRPGFAMVAVATLGIGIGANTGVFSVVNGVLLRPLPYPGSDELVAVWTRYLPSSGLDIPEFPISPPELRDYREQSTTMERVAPYIPTTRTITGEQGDPERLGVAYVGRGMFDLLGVPATVGRTFAPEEEVPNAPAVAVLSHRLWERRFGADPGVVGRTVEVNRRPAEIVGVMPEGFIFPDAEVEIWLPLGLDPASGAGRAAHFLRAVGRLAPGATLDEARSELETITAAWYEEWEHHAMGHFVILEGLRADVVGETADVLWLLLGAVALVLLLACVNVANLILARTEEREREVSVRVALGAGRGRIARQLVTESVVLAAAGAGLGLAIAAWGTRALVAIDPDAIPRLDAVAVDETVLLFTAAVAGVAVVLFGIAPAIQVASGSLAGRIGSRGRSTGTVRRSRLRRGFVIAEAGLSVVVLVAAGLVGRSFVRLEREDVGVDTRGLLSFELTLPSASYPSDDEVVAVYGRLLEHLRGLPGVERASAATDIPLGETPSQNDFYIDGRPKPPPGVPAWNAGVVVVRPEWFETMGIPVVRGRAFTGSEGPEGPYAALINEAAAARYWRGEDPLESRINYDFGDRGRPSLDIVGIAGDTKVDGLAADARPLVYLPHRQAATTWGGTPRSLTISLRVALPPAAVLPSVRATVRELDPKLAVANVGTMDEHIADSLARERLAATLLGAFGAIALLLAVVGIYGIVSYSVARRTREIGIRIALGAEPGRVRRMVIGEGAAPAVMGIVAGLGATLAGSSILEGFLFEVSATDPAILGALGALLASAAVVASWIPARRATRISPTEALAEE